jgi:phosphatidate phosphatase LPIN
MKLGEGGEAFFVFETTDDVPIALRTSPLVSPAGSPKPDSDSDVDATSLQEPDVLDLNKAISSSARTETKSLSGMPMPSSDNLMNTDLGKIISLVVPSRPQVTALLTLDIGSITPLSQSPSDSALVPPRLDSYGGPPGLGRSASEMVLPDNSTDMELGSEYTTRNAMLVEKAEAAMKRRSLSPPAISATDAVNRAIALSKKLSGSNIPSHVTETGDLMLDMTGYKSSEEDALRAEVIARKILAEELEGNYDIGSLIGADEHGNLWIYSSEEAKEAASRRSVINSLKAGEAITEDTASDPGYHSDGEQSISGPLPPARHHRTQSDVQPGFPTPPHSPMQDAAANEPSRNYAKTLRLTSDQLKSLNLKSGANPITFSVNKATCPASMYLWTYKTPIVISDIDGTITK